MRNILVVLAVVILVLLVTLVGVTEKRQTVEEPIESTPIEVSWTVDDVVSMPSDFYFIVKDINSLSILEADVYMDREVVELAVCDDTANTLCIFIELEENEEPHIRKVTQY